MPRKTRPLDRPTKVRDASLMIIASEDQYAVSAYFAAFRTTRTQIIHLSTEDGRSSPRAIIERLDKYKEDNAIVDGDQFWYCGDTDHWIEQNHIQNLVEVLKHCRDKEYGVALSNPCFELWLLLHYGEVSATEGMRCDAIHADLSRLAGGYSKRSGCVIKPTTEMVRLAMKRAKAMAGSAALIPTQMGTGVYLIVEALMLRDSICLQ